MKVIFVEGNDDSNFINEIINKDKNLKIIEYARKKKEKICGIIETINKMDDEYILLADLDGKNRDIRIEELIKKFKNLEKEKIFFSIQEIEAWYLSGISKYYIDKYNIKNKILNNTQDITKEKFEKIFNKQRDTIEIIKLEILSTFDIEKAKVRSESLNIFLKNIL